MDDRGTSASSIQSITGLQSKVDTMHSQVPLATPPQVNPIKKMAFSS